MAAGDRCHAAQADRTLLTLLGALGLLLTLVGIFSITVYPSRGTREIGVRMAIGATPGDVFAMMLSDVGKPVVIGIAIGLGAAALARLRIALFLFENDARPIRSRSRWSR